MVGGQFRQSGRNLHEITKSTFLGQSSGGNMGLGQANILGSGVEFPSLVETLPLMMGEIQALISWKGFLHEVFYVNNKYGKLHNLEIAQLLRFMGLFYPFCCTFSVVVLKI